MRLTRATQIGFLLLILFGFSLTPHAESQSKPIDFKDCGLNQKSRQLAALIMQDPKQPRKQIRCNKLLAKIAFEKAKEMAKLGRVTHIGRSAANRRLIDAGYKLSKSYPRMFENNVEAIAGGISEPDEMWRQFKNSKGHRMHLLAEHEFYLLQNEIGVGFFKDVQSPHVEYWVVYLAHQENSNPYQGQIADSKD